MCQFPKKITANVPSPSTSYLSLPVRISVPCGKCLECKKRRASEWRFRLKQERKDWSQCAFITLTYNNRTLPVFDGERVRFGRKNRGLSTLHVKDLQKFFYKLRTKTYGIIRFKYFAVGEYGYNGTVRPHYHIILYYNGCPPEKLYTTISKVWHKGRITCTSANEHRLSYIADYCSNGAVGFSDRHKPPFMVCSLRTPIGYSWLNSSLARLCFERGERIIKDSFITKSGQRVTYNMCIPRFYLRKMGMQLTYEELLKVNDDQFIKQMYGIPKPMTIICDKLRVTTDYERLCRDSYNKLVNSHKYREYEQHIKFPFSTWLQSFHQFALNDLKKRRSHYLTRTPSLQTSGDSLLLAL